MFLSLEFPGGDKHITLFARDLAGDEGFRSGDSGGFDFDFDSDRSRANRAVRLANEELGAKPFKYFSTLFNQFTWEGTTGWEYWSKDYDKVLKHALVVAAALGLPLYVHNSFDDALIDAAEKAGIQFNFAGAERVANPVTREFEYTNRQIDKGEYIVLTNVVLPDGTPSVKVDLD